MFQALLKTLGLSNKHNRKGCLKCLLVEYKIEITGDKCCKTWWDLIECFVWSGRGSLFKIWCPG